MVFWILKIDSKLFAEQFRKILSKYFLRISKSVCRTTPDSEYTFY